MWTQQSCRVPNTYTKFIFSPKYLENEVYKCLWGSQSIPILYKRESVWQRNLAGMSLLILLEKIPILGMPLFGSFYISVREATVDVVSSSIQCSNRAFSQ